MFDYDDYIRHHQKMSAFQGLMGQVGMGLVGYSQPAAAAAPNVKPSEPEFNPVLLLGDDDEA